MLNNFWDIYIVRGIAGNCFQIQETSGTSGRLWLSVTLGTVATSTTAILYVWDKDPSFNYLSLYSTILYLLIKKLVKVLNLF